MNRVRTFKQSLAKLAKLNAEKDKIEQELKLLA
jgi:hypothetical protein